MRRPGAFRISHSLIVRTGRPGLLGFIFILASAVPAARAFAQDVDPLPNVTSHSVEPRIRLSLDVAADDSMAFPQRPTDVTGREWVSVPLDGFSSEVEIELYGSSRTSSPGGLVTIRYCVTSYEDENKHVTLRLRTPVGWKLLDRQSVDTPFLLEAWDIIEGEIRLEVPKEVEAGIRYRVDLVGEIHGENGSIAVFSYVHMLRRGGIKPGAVGMSGTASVRATNVALDGLGGGSYGSVVDLSSKISSRTSIAFNFRKGSREDNVTNYRIAQDEVRWSGTLSHGGWTAVAANHVTSSGTALTGPSFRGRGMSLRRTRGRLVGELIAAEPMSFTSGSSGHVVRGGAALAGPRGRVGFVFSDFARPGGGYSTAPRYSETIDPDELERLERERKALEKSSRNRVLGAGLDAELRPSEAHRLIVRAGYLELRSARGDTTGGPSAELQYAFRHARGTFAVRWRNMPRSLQGVYLPGDETAFDATVKIAGPWSLTGRRYWTLNRTVGHSYLAQGEGTSLGVRYGQHRWRLDVQGKERSWTYGQPTTTARTLSVSYGMPLGPLSLNAYLERGEHRQDSLRQGAASYYLDLRWSGSTGSRASLSATYFEALNVRPRLRTDALLSLKLGAWEAAGGAWTTWGMIAGADPGGWLQLGIPARYDLVLILGIEYAPPSWGAPSTLLGTVGVRKNILFAVPFLHQPVAYGS